jgi:HupE / UreJ protein
MSSSRSTDLGLCLIFLLSCTILQAHAISMSNGEATLRGDHLDYVLTMPMYEAAHTPDPGRTLLDHIHFSSGGETARLIQKSCHEEPARGVFICAAEYLFGHPVDRLDVECSLYQVTVPNHVHLLRAENGGKHDQAIFDYSFTQTTLRFRPPTAFEIFVQQSFEGMLRAVAGPVQLLFLAALVLAARGRRELLLLAAMFLAGEIAAALIAGALAWQPPVRFVEAAMALSIAYLSVEILFLPEAGGRWLIAGILGGFHGLSLYLVLAGSGFRPAYVLTGAALSELTVIVVLGFALWTLRRRWTMTRLVQASASLLFVFGMTWFFLRLRG